MRILITGATGYIGGEVARAARAAGHEVLALVHSDDAHAHVVAAGYTPVRGDLADPASLVPAVRAADAVVHAGLAGTDPARVDEAATKVMVTALEGSGRRFVYTSGAWVLGDTGGRAAAEYAPVRPAALVAWRGPLEGWLLDAAARGVRTVVLRPGIVFGNGGGIPGMVARGELPLVGDGTQRWSVVHVEDLARLYVAAAERAHPASILHGVAGVVPARDLARALRGSEPSTVDLETARARFGAFADALALDQQLSSAETRATTGWSPQEPIPTVELAEVVR